MLTIEQLTVQFGDHRVLDGLEMQLPTGAIEGLVGLNGSGKTTLLNTIYGYNRRRTGKIYWQQAAVDRRQTAFLETENFFYKSLSGREFLALFPDGTTTGFQADTLAALFQLPLDEWVDTYSTGMRKKLALLTVLKQNKTLMLLDEPFNGMDLESNYILREILLKLKEMGKTILLTSHILETLTPVCDRIHHLQDGKIIRTLQPSEYAAFEHQLRSESARRNRHLIDKAF
jgi:ABC-2 type transport system ATP-binding protein